MEKFQEAIESCGLSEIPTYGINSHGQTEEEVWVSRKKNWIELWLTEVACLFYLVSHAMFFQQLNLITHPAYSPWLSLVSIQKGILFLKYEAS